MTRRRRILLIVGLVLSIAIVGGGGWVWWSMGKPLYAPGDAAKRADLDPNCTEVGPGDAGRWEMPDGIELSWFSHGEGTPVLVLHGGPALPSRAPWPGLQRLDDRYRFHYWAQRGSGDSTRPFDRFDGMGTMEVFRTVEAKLGLGQQVADVERIRRLLGQEKIAVIGHSFGGLIAALYAAEFSERVSALVLIAPADLLVIPSPEGDLFTKIGERMPPGERDAWTAFVTDSLDFGSLPDTSEGDLVRRQQEFARFYAKAVGGDPEQAAQDAVNAGGWASIASFLALGMRHDWREDMAAAKAPSLVVHGTDDLQSETRSRVYVEILPNADFELIDGAQHFPHQSHPDSFAAAIGPFLDAQTSD